MQDASDRELQDKIVAKAWKDENFRKKLVNDPKGALEKEWGVKLPKEVEIHVHEEKGHDIHLVIPRNPASGSLTDEDLDKVAGGQQAGPKWWHTYLKGC